MCGGIQLQAARGQKKSPKTERKDYQKPEQEQAAPSFPVIDNRSLDPFELGNRRLLRKGEHLGFRRLHERNRTQRKVTMAS